LQNDLARRSTNSKHILNSLARSQRFSSLSKLALWVEYPSRCLDEIARDTKHSDREADSARLDQGRRRKASQTDSQEGEKEVGASEK